MSISGRSLSYAPTPYSYTPQTAANATINLDQELRLPSDPAEKDLIDSLAEIYSIIVTLEALEKAFNKDSVSESDYADICRRLLNQYKANLSDARVSARFESLDVFRKAWNIDCPRATERLRIGVPATSTQTGAGTPSQGYSHHPQASLGGGSKSIPAQAYIGATENFITFLDALKLGYATKESLHPLLSEVITCCNKVVEGDFEGKAYIVKWLIKLNGMKPTEELNEDEKKEVDFELQSAYRGFKAAFE